MIVVTTPTGQIGRQVLGSILDSEQPVRVIARDPTRVREPVEVVQGSHDDPDALAKAMAGAGSVFWLVPPNPHVSTTSVADYYLEFTRPLCDAIRSQGVERVVTVSTIGRGVGQNAGMVSAALAMDELIRSTGVHHRAVCPPGFMENMLGQVESIRSQGMFFSPVNGDDKSPYCATKDIAATAAALLLDTDWTGQADVPVLGPEDLSNNDMARIMSDVLGQPIRFQQVGFDDWRAALSRTGMNEAWVQGMVDMFTQHHRTLEHTAPRSPESSTPTTFRQWCEQVLLPAIQN